MEQVRFLRKSQDSLHRERQRATVLIAVVIGALLVLWLAMGVQYEFPSWLTAGGMAVIGALAFVMAVEAVILYRMRKGVTLELTAGTIERHGGKKTERWPCSQMRAAEIGEYPSGEIVYVKVKPGDHAGFVTLAGFENLASVASLVEAAVGDASWVRRKRLRPILSHPAIFGLMIAGACAAGVALWLIPTWLLGPKAGTIAWRVPAAVAIGGLGLRQIANRTLSRAEGARFGGVETLLGAVFVVIAALGLLALL